MQAKLRRQFVFIAMGSLLVVLLLLFGGINIANYVVATNMNDNMLHAIAESGNGYPPRLREGPFAGAPSPEMESMTRFFSVRLDGAGAIVSTSLDYVSSVTGMDAQEYARTVRAGGRTSGYCGEYRYYVYADGADTVQIFLNSGNQLHFMKTLLSISLLMSLGCFAIMLVLVVLLSKRAIAPYVKNMETQKRFITDASHELKTPLTSISMSADILALDGGDDEWIANIRHQTARLARLVGNLVTMSRLDEEMPIPNREDFELSEALWESVEPFLAMAKAQGKVFEQKIEEGLALHGDGAAIQQLVSILLDNALKYSDENGCIRLDAYRKRQRVIIEVFNTCARIDTKNLNRVFDRFYRGDPAHSSAVEGTGVGLAIARAIAHAHGGDISVKSASGNSITFIVTL